MPNGTLPTNIDDHKTCNWGIYYRKFLLIHTNIRIDLIGFHGPTGQYKGVYGEKRMRQLAEMTAKHFLNNSIQLFFYFNNTDSNSPPAAIQDCRYLAQAFKNLKIIHTRD
jgi:uncharacterized protein YecE (DUF72 family)